jgi:hypothetical protein
MLSDQGIYGEKRDEGRKFENKFVNLLIVYGVGCKRGIT